VLKSREWLVWCGDCRGGRLLVLSRSGGVVLVDVGGAGGGDIYIIY